ncbi:synaptonemal complex protein 3 [Lingula anatina]|uniref:Synaptonemal complex protein 3 n=2 Tax=Lingula anatina TaxID=7574 RepID=A0A1S3HDQ9_LINAN|nr:synaptonemal complex protein 3 [Lingula anatina]|eukprot:XP_013384165.1 synaptonemal complex protein 3 [Lingula anatina]
MARGKKTDTEKTAAANTKDLSRFDFDDEADGQAGTPPGSKYETPLVSKAGKKRTYRETEEADEPEPGDFNNELHRMLGCFGAVINSEMSKRKKLEQLTQNSLKKGHVKVDEVLIRQQNERQRLHEEYDKQVSNVLQQLETDLEKTKEQEEKIQNVFRQQLKLTQQSRIIQSQRLKTIRQLHEEYIKGLEKVETDHQSQAAKVQAELKKEMALLQKKALMDTQKQTMDTFKKSLQNMLF